MKYLKAPEIVNQVLVPELHKKFLRDVPSPAKFEQLVKNMGGSISMDHGATRTTDKKVHEFITRLAGALGLVVHNQYEFPEKKLKAVDLQAPNMQGFKWFSTLIEYEKFSTEAKALVEEDMERSKNVLSPRGMELLEMLEKDKQLSEEVAMTLVKEVVYGFLERQGEAVKKTTIERLKGESSELVNALLMGPDFNHLAYSLNDLNIPGWFGLDAIDLLDEYLRQKGFTMLPKIQGEAGTILRQTSTEADLMKFPLEGGEIMKSPGKYLEFIQRGVNRDKEGRMLFTEGKPELFQGFIAANTVKIYDATNIKQ